MVVDDRRRRCCCRIVLCNRYSMLRKYTVIFVMMITIDRFEFVHNVMSTQCVDMIFKPVQFACECVINDGGGGQLIKCIHIYYDDDDDGDNNNNNSNMKGDRETLATKWRPPR